MKSARKINNASIEVLLFVLAAFILLITAINIDSFLTPRAVLGTETKAEDTSQFWREFSQKNPEYIPAWSELGMREKVIEIDPNFIESKP